MSILFPAVKISFLILLSFLGGIVFMFLQPSIRFGFLYVPWLVLILFYWVLMLPQYVNIGVAWLVGFFLDIVYNVPIGENILALVLMVYFVTKVRGKIVLLGFWEMAIVVCGLIICYQTLLFFMQTYAGYYFNAWSILSRAVVSMVIWPFLAQLLYKYQLKCRI